MKERLKININLPDYYEILSEEEINGEKTYIYGQKDEEWNVKIADIITGEYTDKVYCSILMEYLINYVESRKEIKKINSVLVSDDKDHFDKIEHFYEKFGFNIEFRVNENDDRIEKII